MKLLIGLLTVLIFWSLILSAQERNDLEKEQIAKIAQRFLWDQKIKFDVLIDYASEDNRRFTNERLFGEIQSLTESITQSWNGSAWQNSRKANFSYDINNNLIEAFGRVWNGANWVNSDLQTGTYTANTLTEWLRKLWYGSFWLNDEKTTYTYNLNNNWEENISQIWDSSGWINNEKYTYTYDVNNNLIEMLDQLWNISAWVNFLEYTYTFNKSNHMVEQLVQIWIGSWSNFLNYRISYDLNNNISEAIGFEWDGSSWVNYVKYTYSYDTNNNISESLHQRWNVSVWVNDSKTTYSYDLNNQLIEILYQSWDGSSWLNNIKEIYTYNPTGVGEDEISESSYELFNNYPNPFNPSTTIKYSIPTAEFVTLKVYDVLGNEVATLVNEEKPAGSYNVEFNATGLSSGIYFYKLQAGSFTQTKKIILMK